MKIKHSNIPIFIPELACPHQCVFCNQSKISGQIHVPSPSEVPSIINKYLSTMNDGREVEVAFFGGSFTGLPINLQKEYLSVVQSFIKAGNVKGIRLSTRPDYINYDIVNLLTTYGVTAVELGLQSSSDDVLKRSGRGHDFSSVTKAAELIKNVGIELGLQMMIGLPGDNEERVNKTAQDIVALGARTTRIYPTLIIKGTALEKMYEKGLYKPVGLTEAVSWSASCVDFFVKNGVKILRIGLHPSDELKEEKSLVAGPYHRSFSELVFSEYWRRILDKEILINSVLKVNPSQVNHVIGYEACNKKYFNSKNIVLKVVGDESVEKFKYKIGDY